MNGVLQLCSLYNCSLWCCSTVKGVGGGWLVTMTVKDGMLVPAADGMMYASLCVCAHMYSM